MSHPAERPCTRRWIHVGAALLGLSGAPASGHADAPLIARGNAMIRVPPRRALRPSSARNALDAPLPPTPWPRPASRAAPGIVASTIPLVLEDGTVVIGTSNPSLAWISPNGQVRTTALPESRPMGELGAGADGSVLVASDNHVLYTVAPDGSVRNAHLFLGAITARGPIVREDRSVVVLTSPSNSANAEVAILTPLGELAMTRTLPGRLGPGPALGVDGCVWLTLPTGVMCLRNGSGDLVPFQAARGATLVVPLGRDAIAAVVGTQIELLSARGVLRGRVDLGQPAQWVVALPTGNLVALRSGTPSELWFITAEGVVTARIPSPSARIEGVLGDSTGAVLVVGSTGNPGSSGGLTVLEPDGRVRWTLELAATAHRAPVPLPGGGLAMAASDGGVLFIR